MNLLAEALIAAISLFHVLTFYLESVAWQTPGAMRLFRATPESAAATRVLALNQGVYNLFLAAGLAWSLIAPEPTGFQAKLFFLACVTIAGLVGGISVSKRIFAFQALPALIALALVIMYR